MRNSPSFWITSNTLSGGSTDWPTIKPRCDLASVATLDPSARCSRSCLSWSARFAPLALPPRLRASLSSGTPCHLESNSRASWQSAERGLVRREVPGVTIPNKRGNFAIYPPHQFARRFGTGLARTEPESLATPALPRRERAPLLGQRAWVVQWLLNIEECSTLCRLP